MKIGIQTNTLDKQGYGRWGEDTYKKLKEFGFSCTDFNMMDTDSVLYTAPREEADAILLREKELAAQARIEITQVHGPWQCPDRDFTEAGRKERMEKMKISVRSAAVLGCKNWVIHPIMPYGTEEINTENAAKTWDLNIAFMTELLQTAKEYDVTICLENMPMQGFSLAKPADILRVVKAINDDRFKICLDTGHVATFDELDIGDEVRRLGEEIRALHVHDTVSGMDLHLLPNFGKIDWKYFAAALKDINFDGCFSLETFPPNTLSNELLEELSIFLVKSVKEIIS